MKLGYMYYKCRCKCGRKILVEIGLVGVSHNASVSATCGECVGPVYEEFESAQPKAATDIEEWIKKQ